MIQDDVASEETYTSPDVIEYLEKVASDEMDVSKNHRNGVVAVKWHGLNRIDVFKHLAKHGWIVTSTSGEYVWFEKLS